MISRRQLFYFCFIALFFYILYRSISDLPSTDQRISPIEPYNDLSTLMAQIPDDTPTKEIESKYNVDISEISSTICVYSRISEDNFCYTKEFRPRDTYQPVYWCQVLPPGLEIQMDFATNKRVARSSRRASKKVEIEVVSEHLSELQQSVVNLLNASKKPSNDDLIIESLEALQELVYSHKHGIELAENKPIPGTNTNMIDFLLQLFNSSLKIANKVGIVLGTAVSNNIEAQSLIHGYHVLDKVLIRMDREPELRTDWMFFISNFVRNQHKIVHYIFEKSEYSDSTRIAVILNWKFELGSLKYRSRVIEFATDCLNTLSSYPISYDVLLLDKKVLEKWSSVLQEEVLSSMNKSDDTMNNSERNSRKYIVTSGLDCLKILDAFYKISYGQQLMLRKEFKAWKDSNFPSDYFK